MVGWECEELEEESGGIAAKVLQSRSHRKGGEGPVSSQVAKERSKAGAKTAPQAKLDEDKKAFAKLTQPYKKQKIDSQEEMRIFRMWDAEYKRLKALGPSGRKQCPMCARS